jgi:hypothetical protein
VWICSRTAGFHSGSRLAAALRQASTGVRRKVQARPRMRPRTPTQARVATMARGGAATVVMAELGEQGLHRRVAAGGVAGEAADDGGVQPRRDVGLSGGSAQSALQLGLLQLGGGVADVGAAAVEGLVEGAAEAELIAALVGGLIVLLGGHVERGADEGAGGGEAGGVDLVAGEAVAVVREQDVERLLRGVFGLRGERAAEGAAQGFAGGVVAFGLGGRVAAAVGVGGAGAVAG